MPNLLVFYLMCFGTTFLRSTVNCLDFKEVEEGTCNGLVTDPVQNLNMTWLASVRNWYVIAGSKYHIYRATLHHFKDNMEVLENMTEHQFYYESCLTFNSNVSAASSVSTLYGFEPCLQSRHRAIQNTPGDIDYIAITDGSSGNEGVGKGGTSRHYITLTDNKSYVFFTNCNQPSDQKSWDVISVTDKLSQEAVKAIEDHAVLKGFDKSKFAFFRYNSCRPGVLECNPENGSQRSQRSMRGGWSSRN